jgi:hypothetical protein
MKLQSLARVVLIVIPCLFPLRSIAQQDYVARYDAYAGFVYFDTPKINLSERGFHLQSAYNLTPWLVLGVDYSNVNGTLNLVPTELAPALQAELAPLLAHLTPGYHPAVPTSTFTQGFAAGPALVYRGFKHVGLFIHPSLGYVREVATPHPDDVITTLAVSLFFPSKSELDWKPFYGLGGGADIGITSHVGLRMQTDVIWDELLDNFLSRGHWTVRLSIGPSLHFGKNIAQ